MTTLTLNKKELEKRIGKLTEEVEEKIPFFGVEVDDSTEKEITLDITPNRPDLLSLQGFSRSFLQYLGKKAVVSFKVNKPEKDYNVKIDKSVKQVRPFTACAIVRGLKLDDEKIKDLIDIQEKLHLTLGRKRRKVAIGVYPLEKIKLPIRYLAKKPSEIKFVPLEMNKEITGAQVLRQHPTGREYAHLLKDASLYPIFVDADDKILSMPPIINSKETGKITEKTKDVFVECSGHNLVFLKKCLNIIVSALSDMGGKIYALDISDPEKGRFVSPNLEPEKLEFKIGDINKTLGLALSEKEIKRNLEKMGIGFEKIKGKLYALIPPYRTDILHWIDLTEEVAIAYGYDNFKPEIPEISSIADEDKSAIVKKTIANILAGTGLLEVSSFHLAKKRDVKKIYYEFKDFIEVEDSKTEYDVLRMDLICNLMKIFSENSDSSYPQKIFELGRVFELSKSEESETGITEKEKLAIAIADEKVTFTELKQILDYMFKMLDKRYKIEETENPHYIAGRAGKIIVDGKDVGLIGEVAPRCLKNWKIKVPVAALEIDLGWILD